MEDQPLSSTTPATEVDESPWEAVETTFRTFLFEPDMEAVRAVYSAIAAHGLPGQPVWPMVIAPPGSAKTSITQPAEELPNVHAIDKLTANTLLSGQITDGKSERKPSLLHRLGASAILIFTDGSTVLGMKSEELAGVLGDFRRMFDGQLRKEVGTTGESLIWKGRVTIVFNVTPDVDRYHSLFQSLGERFVPVRWHRPGGDEDAEKAALQAMNQNHAEMRTAMNRVVGDLFRNLSTADITVPDAYQRQLAALAEFVVRARTPVARDHQKELIFPPQPEAPTRLAQQLCQLAKGSSRLARRCVVTDRDIDLARRVGFDCIPPLRRQLLDALIAGRKNVLAKSTRAYVRQDLEELGLVRCTNVGTHLSNLAQGLLSRAAGGSPELPPERVDEKGTTEAASPPMGPGGVSVNLEMTATTRHGVPTAVERGPAMTFEEATKLTADWWSQPTDEEEDRYYELLAMVETDQELQ
jgi:hypothetical protein